MCIRDRPVALISLFTSDFIVTLGSSTYPTPALVIFIPVISPLYMGLSMSDKSSVACKLKVAKAVTLLANGLPSAS